MAAWVSTAYWICLAVGIIYTVVAFALGGIADLAGHAGDFDGHGEFSHDYGVDGEAGHGEASGGSGEGGQVIFGPFSPLVIAWFLTCFGAAGILFTRLGNLGAFLTLPLAVAVAFGLAWVLIAFFNRVLGNMQSSSEVRLHTLIGTEAEVTVAVPPMGVGEIAYVAMGGRCVAPARSDEASVIPRHAAVRIMRIVGSIFYVRPLIEERLREEPDTTGVSSATE